LRNPEETRLDAGLFDVDCDHGKVPGLGERDGSFGDLRSTRRRAQFRAVGLCGPQRLLEVHLDRRGLQRFGRIDRTRQIDVEQVGEARIGERDVVVRRDLTALRLREAETLAQHVGFRRRPGGKQLFGGRHVLRGDRNRLVGDGSSLLRLD